MLQNCLFKNVVLLTAIQVYLSGDSILATEGGNAVFRVTSGTTNIPVTVKVETFDFTPPDAQGLVNNNLFLYSIHSCYTIAGLDYQPLITNVTLNRFVGSQILIVNITQDNIDEKREMFGIRLILLEELQQSNVVLGTPAEAIVTILDDESKAKGIHWNNIIHLHTVGNLRINVYTVTSGNVTSGYTTALHIAANVIAIFRCRINNGVFRQCKYRISLVILSNKWCYWLI